MMNPDDIRTHILSLIEARKMTLNDLSLKIGRNQTYLFQYLMKGVPKRLNEIDRRKLAEILNVPEQELTDIPLLPAHQLGTAVAADKIVSTVSSWFKKPLPETVEIAMLDVSACCGAGTDNPEENVVGIWQMPLTDFKSITAASPEHIRIVRAIGDSMQPTINDGDFVFVDTSSQSMTSDGIYVISSAAGLAVKRLQNSFTGDVIVRSDNKAYDSLSFSLSDLHLLGRVVYILNAKKV